MSLVKKAIFFVLTFSYLSTQAQDLILTRKIIDTLSSSYMGGRGYIDNGDKKAAEYIKDQFKNLSLKPFSESYFQHFSLPVNTFPVTPIIKIDGRLLHTGVEFIPIASSTSVNGEFDIFYFDKDILHSKKKLKQLNSQKFDNSVIVIDSEGFDEKKNKSSKKIKELTDLIKAQAFNNKATIVIQNKLTFSVAGFEGLPVIDALRGSVTKSDKKISIALQNEFVPGYSTQNVIGFIPGTLYPDSFLIFSAHYDHLGRLGNEVYFPGANDNASGISMLINLALYYSKPENAPKTSIAFIAFGAEEAGLLGSDYYTQNPLFPLSQIKFLLNLDLVGTGEDGITVVNATEFKSAFDKLISINKEDNLLKEVKSRGKAANSDHYYFTEKGVPAFFIYTMGGIKAYHDVFDRAETLPLTEYKDLFKLLVDFSATFIN